ncbi:DUF2637 domain-containing protein [Streptomyces sp. WAC00469]|uniref:DUF2637 domain-containing protein n=1 Tax=Streptomyces sp. WAC00469 TaxID=2487415 RepID=UPI000F742480|nr:DUF2637 domain-containing protein [Streptomyces sp. WAC00469]RSR95433.1 DUF2637 domain-containing protein [Streptomyces sp. WAC00469]
MSWYEERRADRAAEAAERRKDLAAEREQRRKDQEQAAELRRREERERRTERDRRKAARRERRAALITRLLGEGDTIAALVVMACSIIPAAYFQLTALAAVPGLPVGIAAALTIMLEAGAWVATFAAERAKRLGRPVGRFRAAMWGCAALAASINYTHAPASAHNWLAYVLAAASLGGVFFWELRGAGRHGGKAGRTLAERREAAARRRHALARRFRFRDVHRRYREILTAHPFGMVAPEQAWATAWTDVKGGPLGTDATTLARRLKAVRSVEAVTADTATTPEAAAVELLLADLFGPYGGGDGPASGAPVPAPQNGPQNGGTIVQTRREDTVERLTTLERKGMRRSGRTAPKTPEKEPTKADIARVRKLAQALGGADRLSARNVREALGCAQAYAVRVRDAVRAEDA